MSILIITKFPHPEFDIEPVSCLAPPLGSAGKGCRSIYHANGDINTFYLPSRDLYFSRQATHSLVDPITRVSRQRNKAIMQCFRGPGAI